MNIINRLADLLGKVEPLPVGVYHKQDLQDDKPYRVHLRLRADGSGIFILNASTVLQLNATAAEYAYHFIHGTELEEAARQSEEYLRQYGPSSEWYYLLGVIRDSMGQPDEALRLLRKAVYLDPENVESLIHLALLAERAGDLDGAMNYKRRARKLQDGGKGLREENS